jgi:hypothetical protein
MKSHRAYVNTHPQGYGRYTFSWTCSCGRRGAQRSNESAVRSSARAHERTGS